MQSFHDNPEFGSNLEKNPHVVGLLGNAGLNATDLQIFENLRSRGWSVSIHGSIVDGRITKKSDIDFTLIGDLHTMPEDLRDTLMPGLFAAQALGNIDYISTSIRSQRGRKMSLHISEPAFRVNYPQLDRPYATEYRPAVHAKQGERAYFLPGVDENRGSYLVNFVSTSRTLGGDGSTVTNIPQTGRLTLDDEIVLIGGERKDGLAAERVIYISPSGQVDENPHNLSEEITILGLEFDKMQSDRSLYIDPRDEKRFIAEPIERSMEAVGDFTKTNPTVITSQLFHHLADHWRKVKPNKTR